MYLQDILRFRRTSAGVVPLDVLRALGLPMPDDVLEQFVFDHGTKDDFQYQYGRLDLHAIRWQSATLPAFEVLGCSVCPRFINFVEAVAARLHVVPEHGWEDVCLPPGAALHWQRHGTWMRSPIMLRGALVDSASPLHLVEGHTRTGALRGLVASGFLSDASTHRVWVGEAFQPEKAGDQWRDVLQTEHIPFLDWLMGRVGDAGDIGTIAERLMELRFSSMSRVTFEGDDFDAMLSVTKTDAKLSQMTGAIVIAHREWERFVGE